LHTNAPAARVAEKTIVTPERIALIRASFAKLQPRMDELGGVFYARLFEINPELGGLFPQDIGQQSRALVAMLELIVKMLDFQDKLVPLIQYLGDRHRAVKVKPGHYAPFGEALIWTLKSLLREDFTPETRRAWQEAYTFMADNMS
jgi:nitric oxide dioxygenase